MTNIRTETRSSLVAIKEGQTWQEIITECQKRHNIDSAKVFRIEIITFNDKYWNVTIQYHYQPTFEPQKETTKT